MKRNREPSKKMIRGVVTGFLIVIFALGTLLSTRTVSAATTTFQVSSSTDDVNEDGATFTTNGSTVWIGNGASATASYTGLRFINLTIPSGSTITSARLNLYSTQSQWIGLSMSIAGDLSANSPPFTSASKPSQRSLTTQKVSHSSNVSWAANTWYYLDEIAPVVQEIVSQTGWQNGNSLSIILKGTGSSYGRKSVQSWDGSSAFAAKLEITYTGGSGSTSTLTLTPTSTATATRTSTPTSTATLLPGTPTSTATLTSVPPTATPTAPTISPTPDPTATAVQGNMLTFPIGFGSPDVLPHQIVRTSRDLVYFFGVKGESSPLLYAYWTASPGLPGSGGSFTGFSQVSDSANIISVETAYDGANTIHVLTNGLDGQIKDRPFDLVTNTFRPAKVLDTIGGTLSGYYLGTMGISGMFDRAGSLQLVYWTNGNHILYRSYTYNPSTDTLTLVNGPFQVDTSGNANHPELAVSPLDGSITVAWVSQASSPAQILSRTQSAGSWGAGQVVSTAPVWTSTSSGINIDQGPSLIITPDGIRHLAYIENWRSTSPYDYGRVHEATSNGTSWVDQYIGSYSHDPALATDNAGALYIIGHGYPLNASCISTDDMCIRTRNTDGTWGAPAVLITHQGSQSFDSSPSVKWSVVGYNRPETVEFVFSDVGANGYANPILYYGRINPSGSPTPTPLPTATATPLPFTPTPTTAPTHTLTAQPSQTPSATPTRTLVVTPSSTPVPTLTPTAPPTLTPSATSSGGIPQYVQSRLANAANSVSSQAVTLSNAVTAGHAILLAVSAYSNTTADIASVTDLAGNIYTKAVQIPGPASGNHSLSIWYALNVKATASLTITAFAPTGNAEYITLAAQEYSGVAAVGAVDQTAVGQGSGFSAATGTTPPTTQASELVFGAFLHEQDSASSPTSATPAAGFSLRQTLYDGNYEPLVTEDETVNTTGAYSAGLTWNKTAAWLCAAITLKGG